MSDNRYGLDVEQFRSRVIRPVLVGLEKWSPSAESQVLGTGLTETQLQWLHQIKGPAIGPYQMEPGAYDLHRRWLARPENHKLRDKVDSFAIGKADADEMHGNMYFATAMCRVYYLAVAEALPPADRPDLMAIYWKRYYNTRFGKGTVEKALPHFRYAVRGRA